MLYALLLAFLFRPLVFGLLAAVASAIVFFQLLKNGSNLTSVFTSIYDVIDQKQNDHLSALISAFNFPNLRYKVFLI